MIQAQGHAVLFLPGRGVQRRQGEKRVPRNRGLADRKPGQERRHRLRAGRALACSRPDRLAGENAPACFVARHRFREAQTGLLAKRLEAAEEECPVRNDGTAERTAELIELERLFPVVVFARCIERIVAPVFEKRSAVRVRAALADDGDVAARAKAALCRSEARVHTELRDRFHRCLKAELRTGRVQVPGARVPYVSAIDAVVVQIILLIGFSIEAHARPSAVAVARRAGGQRHQVREVAAVHRQRLDFLRRDIHANLRR